MNENLITFHFNKKDEIQILKFLNEKWIKFKNEFKWEILNNTLAS